MTERSPRLRSLATALLGFASAVLVLKLFSWNEHRLPEGAAVERQAAVSPVPSPSPFPATVFVGQAPGGHPRVTPSAAPRPEAALAEPPRPESEEPGRTSEELEFDVQQRFQAQRPVTAAGVELSKALDASFRARSNVQVRTVECRETLCKLGLGFQNAVEAKDVLDELMIRGPFRKYASMIPMETESPQGFDVALYVAREGDVLPGD